jgi:hypothetical protein
MQYEDDLKKSLTKLYEIKSLIKPLQEEEEKIKIQVKKWLNLNDLNKFSTKDTENHIWSMSKVTSVRKGIKDWKLLESILKESEAALIIKESSTDSYRISCSELNLDNSE